MSKSESDGFRESPVTHEVQAPPGVINGSGGAESNEGATESDPFEGNAEDYAANETRWKIELLECADSMLGLDEAELELALDDAVKRFGMSRGKLKRIISARRSDKSKAKAERNHAEPGDNDNNVKYYPPDYKVSDRGVFVKGLDGKGYSSWQRICTTRIDLLAITRDRRQEN
jgi:hypothetical protein